MYVCRAQLGLENAEHGPIGSSFNYDHVAGDLDMIYIYIYNMLILYIICLSYTCIWLSHAVCIYMYLII